MNDTPIAVTQKSLIDLFWSWSWPARVAWLCVAIVVGVWIYAITDFWIQFDGLDRLVILAGVFWAWNHQRPLYTQSPSNSASFAGLVLLFLGFALVVPSWFALAQIGARPVLTWMLDVTAFACLVGLTWIQFGWRSGFLLAVPFVVSILALPIPATINVHLQAFLQGMTTFTAHQLLVLTGHEVIRKGFVLQLPHGDLGIVEACSGVKALMTFLAVACLTAHYYRFSLIRMFLAVVLALPIVVLANGLRVFLLGVIQENFGQEATLGWRHEVFGGIPVLMGLGLVFFVTKWMARANTSPLNETDSSTFEPHNSSPKWMFVATIMSIVGVALGGMAITHPSVARVAVPDGNAPIDQIPMTIGEWVGKDLPINPEITTTLNYNKAIFRTYSSKLGYDISVWVIYWSTAKSVNGYHHPDICMTVRGNELVLKDEAEISSRENRKIPTTYREFLLENQRQNERQLVIYWTQEGPKFWTVDDEKAAFQMSVFPFRWIVQRMGERPANAADDRIVVLLGTKSWGKAGQRQQLEQFAGDIADHLYRVCPWADPGIAGN